MPSRTARLSKKGCGFATPECRAQRDVAVHPRPAPPPPLLAAPRLSTTALGYLEIRWVIRPVDIEGFPRLAGHASSAALAGLGRCLRGLGSWWATRSGRRSPRCCPARPPSWGD